jgi:hypothetical protein
MNAQILEEVTQGRFGSKVLLRLIVPRAVKVIAFCLILTLLFWLMLLENYAWLFLSLGAISGLVIFWALRFRGNRFGENQGKEDHKRLPEVRSLAEPEETKRTSPVED